MMQDLINHVAEKTGLSPDQAQSAVESVIGFLKQRLPAPIGGALASLVGHAEGGAEGSGQSGNEGLAGEVSSVLGSLLGKRETA